MIFVTVGTHEQPFNRLIQKVDELVSDGKIKRKYSYRLDTRLMNQSTQNGQK